MPEQLPTKVKVENAVAFGVPVLKALGIDPGSVVSFTMSCDGGDFPILSVKRVMGRGDGAAVALIAQQIELRLKEQSAPEEPPRSVFVVGSLSEKLLGSDEIPPGSGV